MEHGDTKMCGVLFDLDGTLVDTYALLQRSFHHAVQDVFGEDRSMAAFDATIGQPLVTQFWRYTDDPETHAALIASYRTFNRAIEAETIAAFPGMDGMLRELVAEGWRLGVVTSKRHGSAKSNLDIFGMMPFFECLVGSDDAERAKPDPLPILVGARKLGLAPERCFYVGDSPYDITAGNAAGSVTVAVHWGQHPIAALRPMHPALECERIADLPEVLRSL